MRQEALAHLRAAGEAGALRRRHALWCLDLVRAAQPSLWGIGRGDEQTTWLARLDAEQDNLRSALTWGAQHHPGLALHLAGRLWRFWRARAWVAEGRRRLEEALAAAPVGASDPHRAGGARVRALVGAGGLAARGRLPRRRLPPGDGPGPGPAVGRLAGGRAGPP